MMAKEIQFGKLYKKTNPSSIYCEYIIPISFKDKYTINIFAVDTGNEGITNIEVLTSQFALDETE